MITQSFLSSVEESNAATNSPSEIQTVQGKEPLKHLLIGSSKAVISTIHYLQVIGYADVGDWSPLLPSPNPGEVMSILNRPIVVQ
ncbi:hypothetical protein NIES37_51220 [Tolypothrix tenuis PCC 7101]|uniref:Uncharacterized protein n=1 Tax=Tolypothrix tenuis PCC 7101 TaxID=231146 RepID=A0A1Z4N5Z3_9CYAN|nr:hypothetical protein [Aulosira sp. FACHB-113]BAZ01124.1 hypothetical protein NIES37_51220 [Tolypothrix tenuis PCC 7101]BAZ74954.1 hypothetical protein NIES50_35340 [Aulosira laxa NIES-50]